MTTSTAATASTSAAPAAAPATSDEFEPASTETAQTAPEPAPPAPIPVLAPYLGLVATVLSTLGGGWLLLAPYALDFRHGAKQLPRAATVDLETGAAVIAVGIVAAVLFSVNLVLRLRGDDPAAAPALRPRHEEAPQSPAAPREAAVTELERPLERPKEADPGAALRELLTPLVAALAADLRSHDQERTQRKGP